MNNKYFTSELYNKYCPAYLERPEEFSEYFDTDCYISDAISEIADNNTSVYYSDILEFISENPAALDEVIKTGFYYIERGTDYDLYKHGQAAEFMTIENEIYENIADYILYAVLDCLCNYDYFGVPITENEIKMIVEFCGTAYEKYDTFSEIRAALSSVFDLTDTEIDTRRLEITTNK